MESISSTANKGVIVTNNVFTYLIVKHQHFAYAIEIKYRTSAVNTHVVDSVLRALKSQQNYSASSVFVVVTRRASWYNYRQPKMKTSNSFCRYRIVRLGGKYKGNVLKHCG